METAEGTCSSCGTLVSPPTARFCPECGTRLGPSTPRSPENRADSSTPPSPETPVGSGRPRPPETRVEIRQEVGKGEATGLEVGEIRGNVTVVHGHVLEVRDPSPEFLKALGEVAAVRTELPPGTDLREMGVPSTQRRAALEAGMDEVLTDLRARDDRGERVEAVQAGEVTLSRVDLLLKQATLLRADADQLFLDAVRDQRDYVDRQKAATPGATTFQLDPEELLAGMDWEGREAKLREALALVQEADRVDPGNPRVLLHLAELTGELSDDPVEEQRILYRARALLEPPRNETDRFLLARTTLLLAVSGEEVHADGVRNARDLFRSLGRADWVRHCDGLLDGAGAGASRPPESGWTAPTHSPPTHSPPDSSFSDSSAPGSFAPGSFFQPVGQWQARISNGGAFHLTLLPGGGMHGSQQIPPYGMEVPFQGQWGFDPATQVLALQGMVGASPFSLGIRIDGEGGGGYRGVGSDGLQYGLTRIAHQPGR